MKNKLHEKIYANVLSDPNRVVNAASVKTWKKEWKW